MGCSAGPSVALAAEDEDEILMPKFLFASRKRPASGSWFWAVSRLWVHAVVVYLFTFCSVFFFLVLLLLGHLFPEEDGTFRRYTGTCRQPAQPSRAHALLLFWSGACRDLALCFHGLIVDTAIQR